MVVPYDQVYHWSDDDGGDDGVAGTMVGEHENCCCYGCYCRGDHPFAVCYYVG